MKFCPICKRNWDDDFRVCPIDGIALQTVDSETDSAGGQTAGPAHLKEKIAEGDTGPVYRAEDPVHGVIAVQLIAPDKLQSAALAEAFEDAVKLAARIDHPNVIRVFSLEHTQDGQTAVLMEYVEGTSLEDYFRSHPSIEVQHSCRLIKEAGAGIQEAHRLSMMHGSLQPSRILIAADGKAKVGGFHRSGLRVDESAVSPGAGGFIYLAPERSGIVQDVALPDYRADVYSLGMILYELLAGKLPYDVKSAPELGVAMDAKPPFPPSMFNPQVSPTLSRVVLKAISKHPVDRHKSVEDFVQEIDAALEPIRQSEAGEAPAAQFAQPRAGGEGMDLFPPQGGGPGKPQGENIWHETADKQKEGEGSLFTWFKTHVGGRKSSMESKPGRMEGDSSYYSQSATYRGADDTVGKTVVVSSRRGRSGRRSLLDTFTGFGRTRFGRDPDLTMGDALPPRRLSSKAYILMGIAAIAVIAGIVLWLTVFSGPDTGKLAVKSSPSEAKVYLDGRYLGTTPLPATEIQAGTYLLRLEKEGHKPREETLRIEPNSIVNNSYPLEQDTIFETELIPGDIAEKEAEPPPIPQAPPQAPATPPQTSKFESAIREAVSRGIFFPPESGNAWEILSDWQRKEGTTPTLAWQESKQLFCTELENIGEDRLRQRDYRDVRELLGKIRKYMEGQSCAANLQIRFDESIKQSLSLQRESIESFMRNGQYVTPDSDNALLRARMILERLDPQDDYAKKKEDEIFKLALDQAQSKSKAGRHQEAVAIYTKLKDYYPNRPGDLGNIERAIDREGEKLKLRERLNESFSVRVKHDHGFLPGSCTGDLRGNGFYIEYTGEHSFKISYAQLRDVGYDDNKITIKSDSGDIKDGEIKLEQIEKNPNPSLLEVYTRIREYRKLNEQYSAPDR
jgi:serine/threonine protein kinase